MARLTTVLLLVALAVGGVALGLAAGEGGGNTISTSAPALSQTQSAPTARSGQRLTINQIYRLTAPGVVDIKVTSTSRFGGPLGGSAETETEGAGVVYNTEGDILTDEHVVANATAIKVTLEDGNQTTAKVVGTDPSEDVAVIHVKEPASELHPIVFANSSRAEVGDPVVAIGSPFGLADSVTSGIVSAVGRSITAPNNFTISDAIQTDAPINPGNSGGPILDDTGHVLGLADQIDTVNRTVDGQGSSSGVGFATTSNTVVRLADAILAGKPIKHAYLGVSLNGGSNGGSEITSVAPSSPASTAGLRPGDVLVAIDGRPVSSTDEAIEQVGAYKPGQTITLTVKRDGGILTKKLTLGTQPRNQPASPG
jgi:putative serine protease PepD